MTTIDINGVHIKNYWNKNPQTSDFLTQILLNEFILFNIEPV